MEVRLIRSYEICGTWYYFRKPKYLILEQIFHKKYCSAPNLFNENIKVSHPRRLTKSKMKEINHPNLRFHWEG